MPTKKNTNKSEKDKEVSTLVPTEKEADTKVVPTVPVVRETTSTDPVTEIPKVETPSSEIPPQPEMVTPASLTQETPAPVTTTMPPQQQNQIVSPVVDQSTDIQDTEIATGTEIRDEGPDKRMTRWILVIVLLILLIVALVAAIFFYYSQFRNGPVNEPVISPQPDTLVTEVTPTPDPNRDEMLESLETVSDSDEINALEEDVEETDLEGIDQELQEIEDEL